MTKAIQNRLSAASAPVIKGPELWLLVLTVLTIPITAVRSSGRTTADKNALRGAWSMELRTDRATRSTIVMNSVDGAGSSKRKIADGRCVKTTSKQSVYQEYPVAPFLPFLSITRKVNLNLTYLSEPSRFALRQSWRRCFQCSRRIALMP